ncbi:hypothetical protein BGZ76_004572 [Entomortierella beljakovae]|nr:hypothetical protein BGZ76_004572 [Entomortierella beljakovae]
MKFFTAIVATAIASVANAAFPTPTNCAPANADISISTFTIEPYPLCINQPACAIGTGVLHNPVTAGSTLSILGTLFGSPVYTDNQDLCTLLAAQGFTCPIPTTMTSIKACVLVKPSAPANVSAVNGGGTVLFCQTANGVMATNC